MTASHADLVLIGPTFTADAAGSWTDGIAIAGDRIVAVDRRSSEALIGPDTTVLDSPLILPAFQDAHVHAPQAGMNALHVDLMGGHSIDEYLTTVRQYAEANPDAEWLLGGGWAIDPFPAGCPSKELLDSVVPDRPVFLMGKDGHDAWVNSAALRIAGLDGGTADPAGGRFARNEDGTLLGTLHEEAANWFNSTVVPAPTDDEWDRAILGAQEHLLSLGIAGWQDAWVTDATFRSYERLDASGALVARVAGALWWERSEGLEQIDRFVAARDGARRDGRFFPDTIKIMVDGVFENHSGSVIDPYHSHPVGAPSTGMLYLEPEVLTRAVTRLDDLGFQVHMHAIGDRAVRVSLDAVEAALQQNGQRGNRHHIAHVELVDPADMTRFRELQVVVNCQTYWAQHEPQTDVHTLPQLGQERFDRLYPFADILATGATLAMGSDWGVTTADPLAQMEVAVTRKDPGNRSADPLGPEQALPLAAAARAFTAGSAFVNHDDDAGWIGIGKRADVVTLDRNVFADPSRTADAKVTRTVVRGVVAYDAG